MDLAKLRTVAAKAKLLASILVLRPLEFYDRVRTWLEYQLEPLWVQPYPYKLRVYQEVISEMEKVTGVNLTGYLEELDRSGFENEICRKRDALAAIAPFRLNHSADFTLARMCYLMVRVLKPDIVIETGVAYGMTSAFMLRAMDINGNGALHSIDLPPVGREADKFVGYLIPDDLRNRWNLHRGISRRVLPQLLRQVGQVGIFVHDSLHTYQNMRFELDIITPHLTKPSAMISDDIDGNPAFYEWVRYSDPIFEAALQEVEKQGIFGLGLFL